MELRELKTIGTKLGDAKDFPIKLGAVENDNWFDGILSRSTWNYKRSLFVCGVCLFNGEECITFETEDYNGTNHFCSPISEFIRIGFVSELTYEIW